MQADAFQVIEIVKYSYVITPLLMCSCVAIVIYMRLVKSYHVSFTSSAPVRTVTPVGTARV
jgi:hypothetical protein